MRRLLLTVFSVVLAGCASLYYGSPKAEVELKNAKGESVGKATFWEDANGVRVLASVRNVSPGTHGFHLHAVGKCDPPEFTSAGGHFNPTGKKHGLRNPDGPHAGDLPNMEVGTNGSGSVEFVTKLITLGAGAHSLFDADGSALVLHANPDDERSDPTGNAGGRIGCGVVRKAS